MTTKICITCKQELDSTKFFALKSQKDGLDYYCKECRVNKTIVTRETNKTKNKCLVEGCKRIHYAKSLCRMHYTRKSRTGSTDRIYTDYVEDKKVYIYDKKKIYYKKHYSLMSKYKVTYEEYVNRTKNGCELCGTFPENSYQVDHDHACCSGPFTCGECVRGIVCNRCNVNINAYEKGTIRKANPYVKRIEQYLAKYGKDNNGQ